MSVVIFAVLTFLSSVANLDFLSPQVALLISAIATALLGSLDGHIEAKTGRAAFGAVSKK